MCEHQRKYPRCFIRISWVLRTKFLVLIKIIDFPEEGPAHELEASEIMLPEGIIIRREFIERRNTMQRISPDHVG